VPNVGSLTQLACGLPVGMLFAAVTGCLAIRHHVQARYGATGNSFTDGKQPVNELSFHLRVELISRMREFYIQSFIIDVHTLRDRVLLIREY
jgi:hypothetical protein